MGSSLKAHLVYGYYLGCPDETGWEIEEAGEYGDFDGPWIVDAHEGDLTEAMKRAILEGHGHALPASDTREWYDLERQFPKLTGVDIESYGKLDYPMYFLVSASDTRSTDDGPVKVHTLYPGHQADTKLKQALRHLGITPKQRNVHWLLVPSYG